MFSRLFKKENKKEDDSVRWARLTAEIHLLESKIDKLEVENEEKDRIIKAYQLREERPIIDAFLGDPSPIDTEQRKLYVAQVAGLHKDILEPKLKQMISNTFALLEQSSNDRDYDQALKGVVYSLREILRWGETMVNEQISFQINEKASSPEDVIN